MFDEADNRNKIITALLYRGFVILSGLERRSKQPAGESGQLTPCGLDFGGSIKPIFCSLSPCVTCAVKIGNKNTVGCMGFQIVGAVCSEIVVFQQLRRLGRAPSSCVKNGDGLV